MQSGPEQLRSWIARRTSTERNPDGNQREAARIIGMDHTFLSQLLSGRRCPALGTAIAIERTTGVPVEAWLSLSNDREAQAVSTESRKARSGRV